MRLNAGAMGRIDGESETFIPEPVIGFPWQMGSTLSMKIDTDGSIGTLVKNQTQAVAFAIQERASSENPGSGPDGAGFRQDDAAYTLEARAVPQAVATPWAVRRLMPVETARLQGFEDNHTAITYRGKPAADGPQYKAHGNSMAVPVIAYILQRMHISMTGRAAA